MQDSVEKALSIFAAQPIKVFCAGRTDAGVHALNQVVHLDTELQREEFSWLRGTNRYLPDDIAIQWCRAMPSTFHARNSALGRRYAYLLLESPVRPALEAGAVGWTFRPLDGAAMLSASHCLIGEHDFSAFRSSECQALSPTKTIRSIEIRKIGDYWRLDIVASAFLHHMVRNIMGCLVAIGNGSRPPEWLASVLESRRRESAAPTFAAQGLYFVGPYYDRQFQVPQQTAAMNWLPR